MRSAPLLEDIAGLHQRSAGDDSDATRPIITVLDGDLATFLDVLPQGLASELARHQEIVRLQEVRLHLQRPVQAPGLRFQSVVVGN